MKIKILLKKLIPMKLRQARGVYLTHRKAIKIDQDMQKIGVELRNDLQEKVTLVPNRIDLISKMKKKAIIAEIGVEYGNLSKKILEISKPEKLHLIDLWPSNQKANRQYIEMHFNQEIKNKTILLHQGLSWDMLENFPDNTFDWVYIDAGHDFDSVLKDLEVCKNKVKKNGYICGHDYVRWSGKGLYRFGVVEAVNVFCNRNNYEMLYLSNEKNRHLSFALKARKEKKRIQTETIFT